MTTTQTNNNIFMTLMKSFRNKVHDFLFCIFVYIKCIFTLLYDFPFPYISGLPLVHTYKYKKKHEQEMLHVLHIKKIFQLRLLYILLFKTIFWTKNEYVRRQQKPDNIIDYANQMDVCMDFLMFMIGKSHFNK